MAKLSLLTGGKGPVSGQASFNIVRQRMEHETRGALALKPGISLREVWEHGAPRLNPAHLSPYPEIAAEINRFRRANWSRLASVSLRLRGARALGVSTYFGALDLAIFRKNGRVVPLGLAGLKVVTDVGVGYIVDAFQNSVEVENQKFHGLGTGSTAEAAGDTALVTELTTEYTGNVRATGTTTEGATANIYRTVATNTLDGTPGAALREHGIFSASSAGVLLDRTVFAAITLSSGDGLQSTYDLTFTSGS